MKFKKLEEYQNFENTQMQAKILELNSEKERLESDLQQYLQERNEIFNSFNVYK
jgi:hypothetical protein